ncbi:hypothetical protein AMS68_006285 [Peltaster fructicola]|uniref:Methyltransferase domain-containing protein n=1 Tax=Peltaster fructicola TaxID=286661 RepID=A0A6H0Y1N3_9PEZI|nr:hypothetical protein AMS68_006285 [Peltaster fructicola]
MSSSNSQPEYVLPRDASETERLNAQDLIWVSSIGFRAHPEIVKSIPKNARIADVGTGTGVWLIRLGSDEYQLEGLDMSDLQYPASHPENLTFHTLNILEPVPEKYKARYDLIHLRLVMAGMKADSWKIAAAHLLEMLKPGGFVQWEEGDFVHFTVLQGEPLAPMAALKKLNDVGIGRNIINKVITDAPVRMTSILRDAGFASSHASITSSDRDPKARQAFTEIMVKVLGATARWHLAQGYKDMFDADEVDKVTSQAMEEAQGARAYMQVAIYCTIGQKAA